MRLGHCWSSQKDTEDGRFAQVGTGDAGLT